MNQTIFLILLSLIAVVPLFVCLFIDDRDDDEHLSNDEWFAKHFLRADDE